MIRKLRRKFILTNMLLVSLVLVAVFAVLVGYNYQRLVHESMDAMAMSLKWNEGAPPVFHFGARPGERPQEEGRGFTMVPVFVVTLDGAGAPTQVMGNGNVEVSAEVVEQAVAAATGHSGTVPGLHLRYLRSTEGMGTARIAFADRSWETSSLLPIIASSLLVGALALGGFFIVSLLLAGLALRPAEEAWEQQRRFVADASHELKTPITVILTNAGILLSHKEDTIARQQKWVEYIQEEAQRMRVLVEDLLFLAKSDASREIALTPSQVDLSQLTWSTLLPFEPVAFEQGVELESQVEPALTVQGYGDQLQRLVAILLDNAVKYAGAGGRVQLTLSRAREGITLSVHNTGPAIPPEHLPHLFERFYRSDDSRARSSGGYGLGLAIAKSILTRHGGTIGVASTPEEGTTFTVHLP